VHYPVGAGLLEYNLHPRSEREFPRKKDRFIGQMSKGTRPHSLSAVAKKRMITLHQCLDQMTPNEPGDPSDQDAHVISDFGSQTIVEQTLESRDKHDEGLQSAIFNLNH
jgi:hypothetical protein